MWVRSLGQERSLGGGHGNPLQCSCLEKPMDRGAWCGLQFMGWQRVGHGWVRMHKQLSSSQNHRKPLTHSHPCQQSLRGKPWLQPLLGCTKAPPHACQGGDREGYIGSWDFPPHQAGMALAVLPSLLTVPVERLHREPGLPAPPGSNKASLPILDGVLLEKA